MAARVLGDLDDLLSLVRFAATLEVIGCIIRCAHSKIPDYDQIPIKLHFGEKALNEMNTIMFQFETTEDNLIHRRSE